MQLQKNTYTLAQLLTEYFTEERSQQMNIGDIIRAGASAFIGSSLSGSAGSSLDPGILIAAILKLVPGVENMEGFDIQAIVEKMKSIGLEEIAVSWLGSGSNQKISRDQIAALFGSEELSSFASRLGITLGEAAGGLQDSLPGMIDQATSDDG